MSECCKVGYSATLAGAHVHNFICSENRGFPSLGDLWKEIILRSNSPWGFHPFQPPNSPKGQVARVFGELPPCMTRGSSLRPLGCLM